MPTISKSFTAAGTSDQLLVPGGFSFSYSLSGTFSGAAQLEKSDNGGLSWENVSGSKTAAASGVVVNILPKPVLFRWNCTARASGTLVTSMATDTKPIQEFRSAAGDVIFRINDTGIDSLVRTDQKRLVQVGAKVGGTSGWVVNAADNKNSLARCPASQTASTLVVPIPFLKVGDTITGFHLVGQIESAGGTVTVDADLRKQTAAAADLTDASVGAITQLSVTAQTVMSASNTRKASLSDAVGADETFYVLITATTAGSTDIDLQAVAIEFTEA